MGQQLNQIIPSHRTQCSNPSTIVRVVQSRECPICHVHHRKLTATPHGQTAVSNDRRVLLCQILQHQTQTPRLPTQIGCTVHPLEPNTTNRAPFRSLCHCQHTVTSIEVLNRVLGITPAKVNHINRHQQHIHFNTGPYARLLTAKTNKNSPLRNTALLTSAQYTGHGRLKQTTNTRTHGHRIDRNKSLTERAPLQRSLSPDACKRRKIVISIHLPHKCIDPVQQTLTLKDFTERCRTCKRPGATRNPRTDGNLKHASAVRLPDMWPNTSMKANTNTNHIRCQSPHHSVEEILIACTSASYTNDKRSTELTRTPRVAPNNSPATHAH